MPISDTVMLLMIIKIFGMVLMSRLHKIVYILREKYGVPFRLGYQTSPSIYSEDLEDDAGVLVAFGFLDIQMTPSGEYGDRVYSVPAKGEKILEYILQDRDVEEMFNRLRLYITGLEGMSMSELVYEAKKLTRHAKL
jgi:hypothetical protein